MCLFSIIDNRVMTYLNSKIFKITINNDIYIGSTIQTLTIRKTALITESKDPKKQKRPLFKMINSLKNKWDGIELELIKDFLCESLQNLHLETRNYILLYGTLNKNLPLRDKREYARDNRERIRKWNRVYQTFTNRESYVRYQRLYAKVKRKMLILR
jgi:hypothetical protein